MFVYNLYTDFHLMLIQCFFTNLENIWCYMHNFFKCIKNEHIYIYKIYIYKVFFWWSNFRTVSLNQLSWWAEPYTEWYTDNIRCHTRWPFSMILAMVSELLVWKSKCLLHIQISVPQQYLINPINLFSVSHTYTYTNTSESQAH